MAQVTSTLLPSWAKGSLADSGRSDLLVKWSGNNELTLDEIAEFKVGRVTRLVRSWF